MKYQISFTLACLLLLEGMALGHGEFPAIFDVITPAESSNHHPVLVSTFGWIQTNGPEANNTLVCEEIYDGDPYPNLFAVSEDVFLVGHFKGVYRITEGGCSAEDLPVDGEERFVRGFAADKEGTIYLATSTGGVTNDVYKSEDEGKTWTPMEAPLEGIYFTSIHSLESGPYSMLVLGFHSETMASVALWWGAEAGWHTQSFPLFLMDELGQPKIYHCDEDTTRCLIGWASDPDNSVYVLDENMDEPTLALTSGTIAIWDAVIAPGGAIVIATINALVRSHDEGVSWETLPDLPPPRCISRIGDTLYACANPYLPDSFAVASSQDSGDSWAPFLSAFNEVHMLYPCSENTDMPALCEQPWESLSAQFGVTTNDEDTTDTPETDVGNPPVNTPSKNGGCRTTHPQGLLSLMLFPLMLLLGWRMRRSLLFVFCLFVIGCGSDASEEGTTDTANISDFDDTALNEDVDTPPSLPYRGNIAIGAFVDSVGNSGVILNAVFAQIDTLEPPYDEDFGPCKVRTVDMSAPPVEPVGVSGGTISMTGDGLLEEVTFIPYDFGEDNGGYAYDHGLGNSVATLLADSGMIEVSVAGEEEIPPMSGSLPTPPEQPVFSPTPAAFAADATEAVEYSWESAGTNTILFELDSFDPTDPEADVIQVRCSFEDNGSASLPTEIVTMLAGKGLSISTARASTLILEGETTSVEVVISRRSLAFSFPP